MADKITACGILLRAADILRLDGWRQDDAGRVGEPRCVLGALRAACLPRHPDIEHAEACGKLRAHVYERFGEADLVQWNDAPDRTADEVIAALRAAAEVCNG